MIYCGLFFCWAPFISGSRKIGFGLLFFNNWNVDKIFAANFRSLVYVMVVAKDMRNGHWQKKLFSTMAGLFIGAGITVLFWGPFWVGPVVFNPIIIQSKWAAQSVFAGIYYSLKPISNYMFASNSHYILTRFVHALLLITVCYFLYPYFIKVIRMVFKKETMADNDFFRL